MHYKRGTALFSTRLAPCPQHLHHHTDKPVAFAPPAPYNNLSNVNICAGAKLTQDGCQIKRVDEAKVQKARNALLPDDLYAELAETFRAMADSNRAKMVYSLLQQELCVCDLATVVGLSDSAVSQHLRVLRTLRLVRSRKEGKMVYYSIADNHVSDLLAVCLEHLRHE